MKTMRTDNRTSCLTLLAVAVALLLTGSPAHASDNDSIGTEAYTRDMAMRRAESGQAHLIRQSVTRNNLTVNGFGEDKPVANNQTDEGRRMNRRVDFIITE